MKKLTLSLLTSGLLVLPLTLTSACSDNANNPSNACDLDCINGSCVLAFGSQTCSCNKGYKKDANALCTECDKNYIKSQNQCIPDPCIDFCNQPNQLCTIKEDKPQCVCNQTTQDNDKNNTCLPKCSTLYPNHSSFCDDSSGYPLWKTNRSCQTEIFFKPHKHTPGDKFYIRSTFNDWKLTNELTKFNEDTYYTVLNLPPGTYPYKFFNQRDNSWFLDPDNPYPMIHQNETNSRLEVHDCNQPLLKIVQPPINDNNTITFAVQAIDGAEASGLKPPIIFRNSATFNAKFDPQKNLLIISDSNPPKAKNIYTIDLETKNGKKAEQLYIPIWNEDLPFDWKNATMYFALTDRFHNGNPANDKKLPNIPDITNWLGGDFAGLKQKIEQGYFKDLGVNAIWISSVSMNTQASTGNASAYHSYWPISTGWTNTNHLPGLKAFEPHFGTEQELKDLVNTAHNHGIRIIVDLVANHVHRDSPLWKKYEKVNPPWFNASPQENCEDIKWERPLTCWFDGNLPDIRYENYEPLKLMVNHAIWLIKETNIDGFRLDAVKHMNDNYLLALRKAVDHIFADTNTRFYMVGETFTGDQEYELIKRYIGKNMLDGQFDFPLYWHALAALVRYEKPLTALAAMTDSNDTRYDDWIIMANFIGNHDLPRIISHAAAQIKDMWGNGSKQQAWDNPPKQPTDPNAYKKLQLAWTFLFTSPGIPLIYYGDEIALPGAGDPDNRRMMTFDNYNDLQIQNLNFVKQISKFRNQNSAIRNGKRKTIKLTDDFWAYTFENNENIVLVALNRSNQPFELIIPNELTSMPWQSFPNNQNIQTLPEKITIQPISIALYTHKKQ